MQFKDHFSGHAAAYGRFRPSYPPELARFLAHAAPARSVALDLATGNGQAAVDLAGMFERVLASDASAAQLAAAKPHPRVTYLRHGAECLPVRTQSVDLVVAAQAAHWFDLTRVHPEIRRVLCPGGLVAFFTYETLRVDAVFDALLDGFYSAVIGPYWPPERRHVEAGYATLDFPYEPIETPAFELVTHWDLPRVIDYLGTWSAVVRFRAERGDDPLLPFAARVRDVWPAGDVRRIRWPIHLRAGRVGPI
jgi:SAM-dependent methyltransferase